MFGSGWDKGWDKGSFWQTFTLRHNTVCFTFYQVALRKILYRIQNINQMWKQYICTERTQLWMFLVQSKVIYLRGDQKNCWKEISIFLLKQCLYTVIWISSRWMFYVQMWKSKTWFELHFRFFLQQNCLLYMIWVMWRLKKVWI